MRPSWATTTERWVAALAGLTVSALGLIVIGLGAVLARMDERS